MTEKQQTIAGTGEAVKGARPARYRKMREPHESIVALDAALVAFLSDLEAIREKHHIADLYVIAANCALDDAGTEAEFINSAHFGDGLKAEMLTAWALGREQARRQEQIGRLVHGGSLMDRNRTRRALANDKD